MRELPTGTVTLLFMGGCSWQAVEAVFETSGEETSLVLDAVASLIDKNLVQQTVQEGEVIRLKLLETIREYGLEMLSSSGEMEKARQVHAAYYLALAQEAAPQLKGLQQAEWFERLAQELDNLRATLAWSLEPANTGPQLETAFQLGEALDEFWWARGLFSEGRAFLEQALARSKEVETAMRARALVAAADLTMALIDDDQAEVLYQESQALCRELGDIRGIAITLQGLSGIAQRKDVALRRSLLEESLALYREVDDKEGIAWSLFWLADTICDQGDYGRGLTLFEESLMLFRELGYKRGIAYCLCFSAYWLFNAARGNQALVHTRLEGSLALFRELGEMNGMAYAFFASGWVALNQGDADTAYGLVEQSLKLWHEMGHGAETVAITLLGRIKTFQGDLASARAFLEKGLIRASKLKDYRALPFGLEGLTRVVATQGDVAWAAHLWGMADSLRERCGIPQTPVERADYEPAIAAARTRLGEQAFSAAWTEGRSMTLEHVLAELK